MALLNTLARRNRIQQQVICPHCWHEFPPEEILWIAAHVDLKTDRKLRKGDFSEALRFLPSRFDVMGNAIDAKGFSCDSLACPNCHLGIHRGLLEIDPIFCSIIGTPSCGKSYYLATLIHKMRQNAFSDHFLQFSDLDPAANHFLIELEEKLFLTRETGKEFLLNDLIKKTDDKLAGIASMYDQVRFGDQEVYFTRPFQFQLTLRQHAAVKSLRNTISRVLCLYDNAGEHYLARSENDNVSNQVTRHLSKSKFLFFLFDPSQDKRFWDWAIKEWNKKANSPAEEQQIEDIASMPQRYRQDTVLQEAASRVRKQLGLGQQQKHKRHLIVIITKADLWAQHLGIDMANEPTLPPRAVKVGEEVIAQFKGLDHARVKATSQKLKEHLRSLCPDLLLAAENFCEEVTYIPVSAFGNRPTVAQREKDGVTRNIAAIKVSDIKPQWVTIPLIYALHLYAPQLMLKTRSKGSSS